MTGVEDLAVMTGVVAGLAIAVGGAVTGITLDRRLSGSHCSCGHSYGAVDKFTGCCTDTVVQTHWLGGIKRTRKRVPCPCREHRPATRIEATS